MITLSKKKSISDWIDLDGIKLKIDYPTRQQEQHLQELFLKDGGKSANSLQYAQYYIKYTLKDWEGVTEDNKSVKMVLIQTDDGSEVEDELWWRFVKNVGQALAIFQKIRENLEFTDADKKK